MNAIQYTPSEVKDFILAVLEDLLPICKSPELIESVRNILRWGLNPFDYCDRILYVKYKGGEIYMSDSIEAYAFQFEDLFVSFTL